MSARGRVTRAHGRVGDLPPLYHGYCSEAPGRIWIGPCEELAVAMDITAAHIRWHRRREEAAT